MLIIGKDLCIKRDVMKKYIIVVLLPILFQASLCFANSAAINKINQQLLPELQYAGKIMKSNLKCEIYTILSALVLYGKKSTVNRALAVLCLKKIKIKLESFKKEENAKISLYDWLFRSNLLIQEIKKAIDEVDKDIKNFSAPSNNNAMYALAGAGITIAAIAGLVWVTQQSGLKAASDSGSVSSLADDDETVSLDSFEDGSSDSPHSADSKISEKPVGALGDIAEPIPSFSQTLNIHGYEVSYPVKAGSMPAKIQHHHNHANLIELPVLQQNREIWKGSGLQVADFGDGKKEYSIEQLQRADGLNCGYHALKNVIYLIAACKKIEQGDFGQANQFLEKMQDVSSFTSLLLPWLNFVIPYRSTNDQRAYRSHPLGNFPSGNELELLLGDGNSQRGIPAELENICNDGLHSHILIVDSFSYFKDLSGSTEKYIDFLQKVITSENGLYGFVVNDAANSDLSHARGSHWFGYVLWKRNGRSFWVYADSLFSRHDEVTTEFVRIFSQTPAEFNVFLAKKNFHIVDVALDNIRSKLSRFVFEENTIHDSLEDVFQQLLREPVSTTPWNQKNVESVMNIVDLAVDYMIGHKDTYGVDYQLFKRYIDQVFDMIRIYDNNTKKKDMLECLLKFKTVKP